MAPKRKARRTNAQNDRKNKSKATSQYEEELEVKTWQIQAENQEKAKVAALENKLKASEEKCKCLQLEVDAGKVTFKELKNKHDNICDQLKDKLECPVCLEIPRTGPVYICPNGHFVCKKCKTEACPTCRDSMGNRKSLLAVTVLEAIEHKCKFADCEDMFSVEKLGEHEKNCKHRSVECPGKCNEMIALSKLVEHLGTATTCGRIGKNNEDDDGGVSHYRISNRTLCEISWKVQTFSFPDADIAVWPWKSDNFFYFTMVMFESENVCSQYKIELEVRERDTYRNSSEFGFIFRGNPCSIDEDKKEWKNLGLIVSSKGMDKILNKTDSSFSVSFKITKK